jgi:tetratricopeptide (TPR) repeat protein
MNKGIYSKYYGLLLLGGFTFLLWACRSHKETHLDNDAAIKLTTKYLEGFRQEFLLQNETAKNIFYNIIATHPTHHPSHYELGKIYINEKNYQQAIEHLSKASKLDPDNYWYKILLAHAYMMIGNYEQAIEVYQKLTAKYPNSTDFFSRLADLYMMANKPEKSLEILNLLEKRNGASEEIYQKKINILLSMGENEKAFQELQKLINLSPDNPEYTFKLAEYYLRTGRLNLGYKFLKKTIEIDPQNTLAQLYLADYYFSVKDTPKAKDQVSWIINSNNFSVDDKIFILLSILDKKELYGDTSIIYTYLESVLKQYPEDAKVWALAGDIYSRNKKNTEAIAAWQQAIRLDSSRYLVWESLLITQLLTDDRKGLLEYLPRAMDLFPEQVHLHIIEAYVNFIKQNYEEIYSSLPLYLKHAQNPDLSTLGNAILYLSEQYISNATKESQEINEINLFSKNELLAYHYFLFLLSYKQDTLKAMQWAEKYNFTHPVHAGLYKSLQAFMSNNYVLALSSIQKVKDQLEFYPEMAELAGDIAIRLNKHDVALDWWTKAYIFTKSSRLGEKIQKYSSHEKK